VAAAIASHGSCATSPAITPALRARTTLSRAVADRRTRRRTVGVQFGSGSVIASPGGERHAHAEPNVQALFLHRDGPATVPRPDGPRGPLGSTPA
jgi:hypothetical protein